MLSPCVSLCYLFFSFFLFVVSTWCKPHTLETKGDKLYNRLFTRAHMQHRPLDGLVWLNEEDAYIQVYEATKWFSNLYIHLIIVPSIIIADYVEIVIHYLRQPQWPADDCTPILIPECSAFQFPRIVYSGYRPIACRVLSHSSSWRPLLYPIWKIR